MPRARRGRGEHSIYQRSDGRWCAAVSGGYDEAGKRRRRIIYGASKKNVQDMLQRLGLPVFATVGSPVTVSTFLNEWLLRQQGRIAPTTRARYEQTVRLHIVPYLGRLKLDRVQTADVQRMVDEQGRRGVSDRNRRMAASVLHTAYRNAIKLKLASYNPVLDVEKPRVATEEIRPLNPSEAQRLLDAVKGDRLEGLYVLALASGLRQGELLALQWADIDFCGMAVSVTKSLEEVSGQHRVKEPKTKKGRRRVELPPFAMQALNGHRRLMLAEGRAAAPVFCDANGGYLRKSNFTRRSFKPLLKRAGLPSIRFHDLRHTAATLLLVQGVDAKIVAERLGHTRVETTQNLYQHVLPGMQRAAADKLQTLLG